MPSIATTPTPSGLVCQEILAQMKNKNEQERKKEVSKTPKVTTFPKTNGKDPVQFKSWWKQVMAILVTKEWSALYDPITKDPIQYGGSIPEIKTHLASSLVNCLTGAALTLILKQTNFSRSRKFREKVYAP